MGLSYNLKGAFDDYHVRKGGVGMVSLAKQSKRWETDAIESYGGVTSIRNSVVVQSDAGMSTHDPLRAHSQHIAGKESFNHSVGLIAMGK